MFFVNFKDIYKMTKKCWKTACSETHATALNGYNFVNSKANFNFQIFTKKIIEINIYDRYFTNLESRK